MQQGENQNKILLKISNEIARIRCKEDLRTIISKTLKKYIQFNDSFILRYNPLNNTCKEYIHHVEKGRSQRTEFVDQLEIEYPLLENDESNIEMPVVQDVETMFNEGNQQVSFIHNAGIKEFVSMKLYDRNEFIGLFVLLSEKKGTFKKQDIRLLQSLSYQIAIATANLLANEEITKRDEEKEILLSLSDEIVRIRGKEDMLDIILNKLKKHIQFDDSFILRYNKNTRSCLPFIYYSEETSSEDPEYKASLDLEYPVSDDSVEVINYPQVYDVATLLPLGIAKIDFMHRSGIKEFVVVKLIEGNELKGLFILLSQKNNSFKRKDLDLLHRLSYQISIATANIIANEEITKREEEKTILLSLSNEIASLKDRKDLFRIVNTRIKQMFSIKEFGIAQINEDKITHSAFMMDLGDVIINHDDFNEITSLKYSIFDTAFSTIMASEDPVILNVNQLAQEPNAPAYVHFWKEVGFHELLCLALRVGGNNVGCIFFNIEENKINNLKSNLLKGVCAQLSVTVSKILASEEIEKREEEKTILLALSNEISVLKNRNDLLQIVNGRIKKLFAIEELGIAKIDENGKTYSAFMIDLGEEIVNHRDFNATTSQNYDINDAIFSQTMNSEDPVIFNVNEIVGLPNMPVFVEFWKKIGLKKVLCAALRAGGKNIGWLVMHIDKNETINPKSNLLKGICAQLSVAISNILANEEIVKREEEKIILLSLSLEIATVKNKNELSELLNTKLTELFPISGFGITLLNEDSQTHSPFVVDAEDDLKNDTDFLEVIVQKYSVNDGVFNHIIKNDKPVTLQVEELAVMAEAPAYVNFWRKMGVKQVIGVPVQAGEKILGCFILLYDLQSNNINNNLLKGVSAQISVALSNILSNEEIKRRESERELLLSINNDIAAVRNNEELLNVINNKLKKILGFSHTLIATINQDKSTVSAFLLDPKSKSKSHPKYLEAKTKNYAINDGVMNIAIKSPSPIIFNLKEFNNKQELPLYLKINFESGISDVAVIRFSKGNDVFGFWMVFFDKEINMDANKLSLIEGLSNQISIALSNIIANDNIQKREKEKSMLLEFSNAMASVSDRKMLGRILKKQLEDLFSIDFFVIHAISKDGKQFKPIIYDPDADFAKHPDFIRRANVNHELKGSVFNKILESENPLFFSLEERLGNLTSQPYMAFLTSRQVNKIASIRIRIGEENIGILDFNQFENKETSIQQNLFKSICSQIAINLSNIITNNEIISREQEKSLLLEFINNIAAIKDRFLLAKVLTNQLNKLFGIEDYAIHALSKDKKRHSPVMFDPDADFAKHPVFQQMIIQPSDVMDGVFNLILNSADTVTFSINDWVNSTNPPTYTDAAVSLGINKLTGVAIRLGDEAIAVMNFRHDESNRFIINNQLFKSICSQLAILISNMLADDEIKSREKEKSMLLDLSNNLAKVRNKNDLRQITDEKLKTLLVVNNISFCYVSPDGKTFGAFILDPMSPSVRHPQYGDITSIMHPVNDGIINKVLASEDPLVYDMEAYIKTNNKVPDYFRMIYDVGMRQMIFSRLKNGKNTIGYLAITKKVKTHIDINQLNLIKAIAAQLSVALANIKANEQIEDQVQEIKKYKNQLEEENSYLQEEINSSFNHRDIIGVSGEMKKVFHMVTQVASSDSTVLLLGETGTGKELIARAIHNTSPRKNNLMVKINCAALPANLIESELFGHERGSFTGATERRIGKFELANNGTLFLDEIGEIPMDLQAKLLRALQEKEIERIGGKTTINLDVRIIAATNRDLEKLMEEGKFRSDLFYRLNIFPIDLPPLRNRRDDIPSLALHFVEKFSKKMGKQVSSLSNKVLNDLMQYNWPGNIRELEHLLERSILLTQGEMIKEIMLPTQKSNSINKNDNEELELKTIDQNEREYILKVIKYTKGKIAGSGGAAELLGIPPSTLTSKMQRLGIRKEHIG